MSDSSSLEVCGSEPPETLTDENGGEWLSGDCWCTRPPGHADDLCACGPCQSRLGMPGWPNEREGAA